MILGTACALGASVLWWRTETVRPETELGTRLARTEAELARVQERVEQAEQRPGTTREIVTRVTAPASEPGSQATASAKPAREEVDPIERAGETLETEGRDPVWAPETERSLTTAYRTPSLAGSRLGDVRCESSLCRMSFSHDDDDAVAKFHESAALTNPLPDSSLLVRVQPGAGGEYESTVFVKRPRPSRN